MRKQWYPVVESYNLSFGKVSSRKKSFTSSINLAGMYLGREDIYHLKIPFLPSQCRTRMGLGPEALDQLNPGCSDYEIPGL